VIFRVSVNETLNFYAIVLVIRRLPLGGGGTMGPGRPLVAMVLEGGGGGTMGPGRPLVKLPLGGGGTMGPGSPLVAT